MDELELRAHRYATIRYILAVVEIIYTVTLLLVFILSGVSKELALWLQQISANRYAVIGLYVFIALIVYYVLTFPLNFYRSFVLEHRFCLSEQTKKDWLIDQLKGSLLSYCFAFILAAAYYYILRNFLGSWWLVMTLFWIFFNVIVAKVTPVIIIPLFFKYKRLSDENLRERIMNLAGKMKLKILDVFEIDLSKKTLKANAAFLGIGGTKRVILADTLKDKYTNDEIEVILAHEFAHYRLKHLLKLLLVNSCVITLCFYLIYVTSDYVLGLFGLHSLWDIATLPVLPLYFIIIGTILQPFEMSVSRHFERRADILALKVTGLKDAFISMMEKLSRQNLADRSPHPAIKYFFFDHPPVDERISLAQSQPP